MRVAIATLLVAGALSPMISFAADAAAKPALEKSEEKALTTTVLMETSMGNITLELDNEKAPKTVENFVAYASEGFYDGTIFHRVISNFMIQGGGFTPDMNQKPTKDPIANEANNGLKNDIGTIAMARTRDPHSATGQFFINARDNDFLNFSAESIQGWGYAVFGKVTEGLEVVRSIEAVKTGRQGMHQDVPLDPVVIQKVTVQTGDAPDAPTDVDVAPAE